MRPSLPPLPRSLLQDLRGCNQLQSLTLACPSLRAIDATFCSSLGCVSAAACWAGHKLAGCNEDVLPVLWAG